VPDIAYLNDRFLEKAEIRISPDDRAFLLGDGVYEVLRFYGGAPMALDDHLSRLERSLAALRIEGVDVASIAPVFERLASENGLQEALVYLQVSRGVAPRRHAFPAAGTPPTVYAFASACSFPEERWTRGVPVILVPDQRWARCNIKTIALLPNILANQQAQEASVEEAVFVRDGFVTEGSHTNVFAVNGGQVFTYPDSNYVLPGVTRGIVIRLCQELHIPLTLRPFSVEELLSADEAFITSTAEEVLPVVNVDGHTIGRGEPGPISRRLLAAYRKLI